MPNDYITNIKVDGTTYDIKDTTSGYITGITVDNGSATTNLVTSSSHPYDASTNALATMADVGAAGGGTVTSVGVSNDTNGGLTVSGSPITSSGTITVGHTNVLDSAQTTQAVYPIKIDKNGHISAYGSAVTISDVNVTQTNATPSSYTYWRPLIIGSSSSATEGFTPSTTTNTTFTFNTLEVQPSSGTIRAGALKLYNGSYTSNISDTVLTANRTLTVPDKSGTIAVTSDLPTVNDGALKLQKDSGTASSIYTANQSGDSTMKFTTTSVGSASGWSAGTMTTIDTSKFSGGSFTQGTDSFTANTPTTIDTSKFSGGSFTRGAFSGGSFTQGTDSFTANTPTTIDTSKFSGGSFTQGTFTQGSLTMSGGGSSATSPSTLTVSFTAPSHASDSFTSASLSSGFYSAGTSASFTQGTDSFTAATHANDTFVGASLSSGFYSAGTPASFTQGTDQHTAASLGSGFYSAGTAPSLTVSSTTVVNDITTV